MASELGGETPAGANVDHALVLRQVGLVADECPARVVAVEAASLHLPRVGVRGDELQSRQLIEAVLVGDVIQEDERLTPLALVFEQ